jgi:hypothetical protein
MQDRHLTVANAAFGKNSDCASVSESFNRSADGFTVGAMSIRREGVDGAEKLSHERPRKELRHGHPINFSPKDSGNNERIEMTDVVRGKEKAVSALRVFAMQDVNAPDRSK